MRSLIMCSFSLIMNSVNYIMRYSHYVIFARARSMCSSLCAIFMRFSYMLFLCASFMLSFCVLSLCALFISSFCSLFLCNRFMFSFCVIFMHSLYSLFLCLISCVPFMHSFVCVLFIAHAQKVLMHSNKYSRWQDGGHTKEVTLSNQRASFLKEKTSTDVVCHLCIKDFLKLGFTDRNAIMSLRIEYSNFGLYFCDTYSLNGKFNWRQVFSKRNVQ